MWVYLLLLIFIFLLLLIAAIYVVRLAHNTLKNYINNKFLSWLLSFLPILLFILGFFIDTINAIVVDIHLIIIISLIKLVFFLYQKITKKKKVSEYIILGCGVLITILYLSYGYYLAHHVLETDYTVYTEKELGVTNFRIVQISDSHIGATFTGKSFIKYMEKINSLNPDIVVVTGDFVDDSTSYEDMINGIDGLSRIKTQYGIYFIYGNHDRGYYNHRDYNDNDIRKALKEKGILILQDAWTKLNDNIVLIGRDDAQNKDRVPAYELTREIDQDKYIIMLDHEPNDYDNEIKSRADLVLSGHTHGGQLFPLGQLGLLLGSNDKIYGMETIDNTTFIVNSGISDWEIKFKTGTISEYVVIDIKIMDNN